MSDISSIMAANNPSTKTTGEKKDANSSLTGDFTDFLKLLTTQLQNQDPTSPTDTNEFTNQIIGFSEVEQSVNTNSKLDKLVASNVATAESAQLSSAVNYIGKMVEAEGSTVMVKDGEEPQFSYELEEGVRQSTISIFTEKGELVGTFQGKGVAGKHNIVWDAKDVDGARVAPGKYVVKVAAMDTDGKASDAKTFVVGEVTGVEIKDGKAELRVEDEYLVPLADVQSVVPKSIVSESDDASDDQNAAA